MRERFRLYVAHALIIVLCYAARVETEGVLGNSEWGYIPGSLYVLFLHEKESLGAGRQNFFLLRDK